MKKYLDNLYEQGREDAIQELLYELPATRMISITEITSCADKVLKEYPSNAPYVCHMEEHSDEVGNVYYMCSNCGNTSWTIPYYCSECGCKVEVE